LPAWALRPNGGEFNFGVIDVQGVFHQALHLQLLQRALEVFWHWKR
jgi:hypothetical protein